MNELQMNEWTIERTNDWMIELGGILDQVPDRLETMNSIRTEELRTFVSYLESYEQSNYLKEYSGN